MTTEQTRELIQEAPSSCLPHKPTLRNRIKKDAKCTVAQVSDQRKAEKDRKMKQGAGCGLTVRESVHSGLKQVYTVLREENIQFNIQKVKASLQKV